MVGLVDEITASIAVFCDSLNVSIEVCIYHKIII